MLTAMKRVTSGDYIRDLLRRMRAGIPGLGIRTTFIVGFPGETEEDFEELLEFIREFRFERAGCFPILQGRRHPRRQDGRPHPPRHPQEPLVPRHGRAPDDRRRNQPSAGRQSRPRARRTTRRRPHPVGRPGNRRLRHRGRSLPVGEFADITIGDWRGYDLVAAR